MKLFAGLTALVLAFSQVASAVTYYVATNGPGGVATSWDTAASNIQDAISLCSAGDVVLVSNGVYDTGGVTNFPADTVLSNRVAINKAITVRSANNDPANTIIKGAWDPVTTNGPAAVRGVYMVNASSLIGFTVSNGATLDNANNEGGNGGGIWGASINTVVSNCVIVGNSAIGSGGGAYRGTLYDSTLALNSAGCAFWSRGGGGAKGSTLYGCIVSNNSSGNGIGTLECTLYDCTVVNNTLGLYGAGGGVCNSTASNCTLIGNQIGAYHLSTLYNSRLLSNTANYGGGAAGQCKLYDCTLIGNSASQNGGGVEDYCVLYDCLLLSNSAQYGAGAANNCTLSNCTLIGNSKIGGNGNTGGGADNCSLYNCLLAGNLSGSGGGAYKSSLYNCTVVSNTATVAGGGVWSNSVFNSIIYFNTAPSGSNVFNLASATNSCTAPDPGVGSGNIVGDPKFIKFLTGDYRLSGSSPCINQGLNQDWMTYSLDLDGKKRIEGTTVDMGAYEFVAKGTVVLVR